MMKMMKYILILSLVTTQAFAHEMIPTYPKFGASFMEGLSKTTMTLFNKRADVEYYEIAVFDKDWAPIPFVSEYTVFKIPYLSTVTFDVYVRDEDKLKVTFICSRSKLRKENLKRTAISSRICSKVKSGILR